jgi:hypothetical protein
VIQQILDSWQLDAQQAHFKLAMKSNSQVAMQPPFNENLLTRLWYTLDFASLCIYLEYMKFAKIAVVHILGSVQDECCFSSLSFLKNKLRNHLNDHLGVVVGMYSQKVFNLHTFPYDQYFDVWANVGFRHRYQGCHR